MIICSRHNVFLTIWCSMTGAKCHQACLRSFYNVTTWDVMETRTPIELLGNDKAFGHSRGDACQREHMAGRITCFHNVHREPSSTKHSPLKCADAGGAETYWVRLNNRQQYGLLAASAGHRNRLHVAQFPFKTSENIFLPVCYWYHYVPAVHCRGWAHSPHTHTMTGGCHTYTFACSNVLFTDCCTGRSKTKHSPAAIQAQADTNLTRHMKEH